MPPPYIKPLTTLIYKVLRSRSKYKTLLDSKNFSCPQKSSKSYIKTREENMKMKKNRAENLTTVEVDTVSGEFFITIPQWILDEKGWYEGTNLNIEVDGDCLIVTDRG